MRTLRSLALVAALALVALAPSACSTREDTCGELRSNLKRCGLSAASLACDAVDTAALDYVVQSFAENGCTGATTTDGSVDPRLCQAAGWPCPPPPTPEPGGAKPNGMLVFVSGIDESPVFDWHPHILASLEASYGKDAVLHVKVRGWASVPERAADLWDAVRDVRERTGRKVNLVCYAVSGLDCRWLVSPGGLFADDAPRQAEAADAVASVTTIATPHRGTRVADATLAALESGTAQDLISAFVGNETAKTLPSGGALQRTLQGLTMDRAIEFNAAAIDAEGVVYQSFAGVSHVLGRSSAASEAQIADSCRNAEGAVALYRAEGRNDTMNEVLWITAPWASTSRADDGKVVSSPSDGMVSVASAKWGEFKGCVPADHYDVIGQVGKTTRDGNSGFDAVRFYRWIASDLAARGL